MSLLKTSIYCSWMHTRYSQPMLYTKLLDLINVLVLMSVYDLHVYFVVVKIIKACAAFFILLNALIMKIPIYCYLPLTIILLTYTVATGHMTT